VTVGAHAIMFGTDLRHTAATDTADPSQTLIGVGPDPLSIRAVRLGTASFLTDRGQQRLRAWQFSFAGFATPAAVLAVKHAFPARHFPGSAGMIGGPRQMTATVSPAGLAVHRSTTSDKRFPAPPQSRLN
jgi:hypothetical protein